MNKNRFMHLRGLQAGFSIVELMVAVTISMILFAVIVQLFASNKQAYRIQEGSSALNENARYAVSHLEYFLRLADHWAGVEASAVSVNAGVPTVSGDCADAVVSTVGFRGYNGGASKPLDCMPGTYEPNTDAFFIRYVASHANNLPVTDFTAPVLGGVPQLGALPSQSYITGSNGTGLWVRTGIGQSAQIFENTEFSSLPAELNPSSVSENEFINSRFHAMLYYIRTGSDGVPTLVRRALNPNMSFTEQDIVAGVENMQLLYGVDSNADFVAERYETAPSDWSRVVSVRVSLIVSNLERDMTVTDTTTYRLLDTTWTPPTDARNFRRAQFDFTVQIRNAIRG